MLAIIYRTNTKHNDLPHQSSAQLFWLETVLPKDELTQDKNVLDWLYMIVGVDEVGRGCWAGPLVAGAVLLRAPIPGLKDSKKLSKQQREKLDAVIRVEAVAFGIGWVTPAEIDDLGLTKAVGLAMHRAMADITGDYDEVIIDGNINYFKELPNARALVAADNLVPEVSAASIIAKVARDKFMAGQSVQFPGYGFDKHVGYGTLLHRMALKELGLCALHRRSFKPIQLLA